ncbi:MAG: peroxiredoxin family protein [Armatimonadota bacterium]
MIALSHDSPDAIAAFLGEHDLSIGVVPGPGGRVANAYNAVFTPRAYYVRAPTAPGEPARIAWVQPRSGMPPEACLRAWGISMEEGEANVAQQ